MLFNSYIFIFVFLPVVLVVWLKLRKAANPVWPIGWLVVASLFYYGWWQPRFLWVLLFSIGVNLVFGKLLVSGDLTRSKAKLVMIAGVVFNLCLLGYFKYAGFLLLNWNSITGAGLRIPEIVLPIGISFITFQKIAFLVDAYRGEVRSFSPLNYFLFVTFFPQLIAGPIVHHAGILPQFSTNHRRDTRADISVGLAIFIVGLFKKVAVADLLAVYADAGFDTIKSGGSLDFASAWIAVLSYSFQLYYDFSGYSDMAVGLGRMFGITLPINFNSPYQATSIVEFWRRWHMTLSRFLRDYLYFPLGGNRLGPVRRQFNLMLTMLLGGLWHGANWTFVIWGGLHGLMLSLNHFWRQWRKSETAVQAGLLSRAGRVLVTFVAVTLAWVFFRAENVSEAWRMLAALSPFDSGVADSLNEMRRGQFSRVFRDNGILHWFKARELWPPSLPPNYLAVSAKPAGIILVLTMLVTFACPNVASLFRRFSPVLEMPPNLQEADTGASKSPGCITVLDRREAWVLAAMLVVSILLLSRVSPFLYFQF